MFTDGLIAKEIEGFKPEVVAAFLVGLAAVLRSFDQGTPSLFSTAEFDRIFFEELTQQWRDNPVLHQADFERVLGLRDLLNRALEHPEMKNLYPPRGADH